VPRLLAGGKTVVVSRFNYGLFLVKSRRRRSDAPSIFTTFGYWVCDVSVVVGNYLVETMQSGRAVVSLDMSDPNIRTR
jgi:hypothetical protein